MEDQSTDIERLRQLLRATSQRALPTAEFEQHFLRLYAELPSDLDAAESEALDEVFWAIERYVDDPMLRRSGDIDEAQLRRVVSTCLVVLDNVAEGA